MTKTRFFRSSGVKCWSWIAFTLSPHTFERVEMNRRPLFQNTASTTLLIWRASAGVKSCVPGSDSLAKPQSAKK